MKKKSNGILKNAGLIIGGSILYALGMNLFLTPLKLFSGGGVGLAQLLTLFIEQFIDVGSFNLYGCSLPFSRLEKTFL